MITFYFMLLCVEGICLLNVLITAVILIIRIVRKRTVRKEIAVIGISFSLLICTFLFTESHPTHPRYNDWFVVGSHISEVKEVYGEFDTGEYTPGQRGRVAYYLFEHQGGVMPCHLPHYYYIEYDRSGIVTKIYEGGPIGG